MALVNGLSGQPTGLLGWVTDEQSPAPLAGETVVVKGSSLFVITDDRSWLKHSVLPMT